MGGDTQSTEATEASHMHTREDGSLECKICYNRGYEWWLLEQAKKRNPLIQTYALSWGVPAWVGKLPNASASRGNFWTDDNIEYHVRWAVGLHKYHGIQLDYMGIWNEKNPELDWIVRLRKALDVEPSGIGRKVKLVVADTRWSICSQLLANKTVADVVSKIGVHYPINALCPVGGVDRWGRPCGDVPAPSECYALKKPLWTSEGWNFDVRNNYQGALNLAAVLNKNWVITRQQATIIWTLVFSWCVLVEVVRLKILQFLCRCLSG